ncbi:hypothetical protein [Pseudomonas defluvii]|uniref:hypothetical protein n=1 Tax=Pseudomonas defluvii TaxID=1876757 RepID=UPI003905B3B3
MKYSRLALMGVLSLASTLALAEGGSDRLQARYEAIFAAQQQAPDNVASVEAPEQAAEHADAESEG